MNKLPVDRGWAWAVAVGAVINTFWSLGSFSVYGVIFVEVIEVYQATSALTAVMFGVFMATCAVAVMVQALLTGKVSDRTLGGVAAVSFALSLILQFRAPNVYFFIVTFGVFGGIGSTFTMYTAIVQLGVYFDRKLSIASGLAFAGASCGQFIIPQILRVLLQAYGFRGAMLVFGACHLHPLISALLFRPVSFYQRTSRNQLFLSENKNSGISDNPHELEKDLAVEANDSFHPEATADKSVESIRDVTEVPDTDTMGPSTTQDAPRSIKKAFRALCTYPLFHVFAAGRCLSVIANYLMMLFIPPLASSQGFTLSDVALLLTVMGAVDLPSRPFHGWVVSLKRIDVTYYVGITSVVCSAIVLVCTFLQSYVVIFIMGICMTVLFNPNLCLMNVITIAAVGKELFPRAMMLYMMVTYVSLTILPTVFGLLYDHLGSYTVPLVICSVCGLVGGLLTVLEGRLRDRRVLGLPH